MVIFKCKMCGGDLNVTAGDKIAECEYCGSTQTIPDGSDEKKTNLFNRANRLRMDNEFDKAAGVYESLVSEFPEDAEGYWGLVLCSYGIEYVDDSKTGKKIPTCHRTLTSSIMDDDNFIQACENADILARKIYREEAKAIDKLQKQIIAVVENEDPYDVFICYKETDDITKQRTEDSLIAQDIYTELIKEGYKVFFSRVTLRDKAGTEYEPYIYAALKSAKIMLAIGTKFDYYDAVWVKNEWSRYISMMADDSSKHLIPCFKNLDAYDIPKEFKNLQALDMGEVTFFKNLTDNVERFILKPKEEHIIIEGSVSSSALTKRGYIYLEDKDFVNANEYFDRALDENPEDSRAYLGKFLATLQISTIEETDNYLLKIDTFKDFERALRFAKSQEKAFLEKVKEKSEKKYLLACFVGGLEKHIKKQEIAEITYCDANKLMQKNTADDYNLAIDMFKKIEGYKDSEKLKELCNIKIKEIQTENEFARKEKIYNDAKALMQKDVAEEYANAINLLESITDYKDSAPLIVQCKSRINDIEIATQNKYRKIFEHYSIKNLTTIETSGYHAVGLKSDGTVITVGGPGEVNYWSDIIAISTGAKLTVGLKSDGTVVSASNNRTTKCNVTGWKNIVAISAGKFHTVGLKSNGTVVADGENKDGQCNVSGWRNIVAISAGGHHTVGLKADGTAVAVGTNYNITIGTAYLSIDFSYDKQNGQCNVSSWKDIVAISAGTAHTVGLKADGTVVATGSNKYGECSVSGWKDIVAISAGHGVTIGLKSDGTVVATGYNADGECNVFNWTNIIAISTDGSETIGLKSDGTVVATGFNYFNFGPKRIQKKLTDIALPSKAKTKVEYMEEKKQQALYRATDVCQHCGGTFKGLFTKTCTRCGKKKDY